jgi:hypothetical protein
MKKKNIQQPTPMDREQASTSLLPHCGIRLGKTPNSDWHREQASNFRKGRPREAKGLLRGLISIDKRKANGYKCL